MSFSKRLVAWYQHSGRHNLPWQLNKTPYRVWISEIMLQQTQVATVIPYYIQFMNRFKELSDLAAASDDEVLSYWSGLGYYSRARNLHKTAKIIEDEFNGIFPNTVEALEALPGIGRSTAGAILSFSMGIPAVILDGNVKRVLTRHFAVDGWPGKTAVHKQLWDIAASLTPKKHPHHYNQAIMDLGASLCSRSKPACPECPLNKTCKALASHAVKNYPNSKPKPTKPFPEKNIRMLLLHNTDGDLLLEKRPSYGIWGGLWSFPECGLDDDIADICLSQYASTMRHIKNLTPFSHKFSHYQLNIHPSIIYVENNVMLLQQGKEHCWQAPHSTLPGGIPAPVNRVFKLLGKHHHEQNHTV